MSIGRRLLASFLSLAMFLTVVGMNGLSAIRAEEYSEEPTVTKTYQIVLQGMVRTLHLTMPRDAVNQINVTEINSDNTAFKVTSNSNLFYATNLSGNQSSFNPGYNRSFGEGDKFGAVPNRGWFSLDEDGQQSYHKIDNDRVSDPAFLLYLTNTSLPYAFNAEVNYNVTIKRKTRVISYNRNAEHGTFTIDGDVSSRANKTATYLKYSSHNVFIQADAGYEIKALRVNGQIISEASSQATYSGTILSLDRNFNYDVEYARRFTVTYKDGSTILSTQKVWEGDPLPTIDDPTKPGQRFTGWSPSLPATVTSDLTFTAQWETNQYTLSATAEGPGLVSPERRIVNAGTSASVVGNANAGDENTTNYVESVQVGNVTKYTDRNELRPSYSVAVTNINEDTNVHYVFNSAYKTTVTAKGDGMVSFGGQSLINQTQSSFMKKGSSVALQLSSTHPVSVTARLNGEDISSQLQWDARTQSGSLTLENIQQANQVVIQFTRVYTITYSDGLNSQIFENEAYSVHSGDQVPDFQNEQALNSRPGYHFTGWSPAKPETASESMTLVAQWAVNTYTVSASKEGSGEVRVGSAEVEYNGSSTITITPTVGYYVQSVSVNGQANTTIPSGGGQLVLSSIQENQQVQVVFAKRGNVNASVEGPGQISPSGKQYFEPNQSLTFTTQADEGAKLIELVVDGQKVDETSYVFEQDGRDHTIKAVFKKVYTVQYVDENGSVLETYVDRLEGSDTPSCELPSVEGKTGSWTPSVAETVTANVTYRANYTPIQFHLTLTKTGIGDGQLTGPDMVNYGEDASVTIVPDEQSYIRLVKVNGENIDLTTQPATRSRRSADDERSLTIENIREDTTVEVDFGRLYTITIESEGLEGFDSVTQVRDGQSYTRSIDLPEGYGLYMLTKDGESIDLDDRTALTIELDSVDQDHTYHLVIKPWYTVTYQKGDEVLAEFNHQFDGNPTPSIENPTQEGYTFAGWSPEVSDQVTGDVVYMAQFAKKRPANQPGKRIQTATSVSWLASLMTMTISLLLMVVLVFKKRI